MTIPSAIAEYLKSCLFVCIWVFIYWYSESIFRTLSIKWAKMKLPNYS